MGLLNGSKFQNSLKINGAVEYIILLIITNEFSRLSNHKAALLTDRM